MNPLSTIAFAPQIAAAAARHNVDPKLLAAVAAQETGGPGATSGRNIVGDGGHGHGLFQIDDRSHPFASTPAAMDPAKNADYAAGLLSGLLKTYGGNVRMALSAYNAGSPNATGTTTDWGNGKAVGYADSVMRHYAQLAGSGATASPSASALGARDAAMPALADASANANGLRSIAALLNTPAYSDTQATPCPSVPLTSATDPAKPAPTETALSEDLAVDDDADPSQPAVTA